MALLTTLEDLRGYGQDYRIVPVAKEILSDMVTPIEVMRRLKKVSKRNFLLESVVNQSYTGRYTFLGYDPKLCIVLKDHKIRVMDLRAKSETEISVGTEGAEDATPSAFIRRLMKDYRSPRPKALPAFTGGLVGYFGYDYIKYSEPVLDFPKDDTEDFADATWMLFDKCIAFDNIRQRIVLITNISTENLSEGYAKALAELDEMENLILNGEKEVIPKGRMLSDFQPRFSKERYCDMVEKGKRYIFEGDIFQVVLSNRFEADYAGSLFDTYRQLRGSNPSPYMFYFDIDGEELAGASPETLVKLENGDLYTYPWREPVPGARHRKRIRHWRKGSLRMRRNWQSTTCLWISVEMIWAGSVNTAVSR